MSGRVGGGPTPADRLLAFDHGIESVDVIGKSEPQPRLPDMTPLIPSDTANRSQLDAILNAPTVETAIQDFLAPALDNREVLRPETYARLCREVVAALEPLAVPADGKPDPAITDLLALLREQEGLRDLLSVFRNALHGA